MQTTPSQQSVTLDGLTYRLLIHRVSPRSPEAPRLLIVSHMPSPQAFEVLRVCVSAIKRFTPEEHEIWVVDNNSPEAHHLRELTDINLVLSRTEPLPPERRGPLARLRGKANQRLMGSYANAAALEIALRLIDPDTHHVMSLHMDTMPCREGWLSHLRSKIKGEIAAAGVRMDTARTPEGILHVLGMMVDHQIFQRIGLSFWPELPQHDVGDLVTVRLREQGHSVMACANTLWQPELIERIPAGSPLRSLHVDRSFDDEGNVIFLHLGRGVRKAAGLREHGTSTEEWIQFADEHILR